MKSDLSVRSLSFDSVMSIRPLSVDDTDKVYVVNRA